jgi:choline dehydrogenase-like flavoprotein
MSPETRKTDVLIVGTGPVGCTFARYLVPSGRTVMMTDAGACHSPRPGEHLKNAYTYQRDLDKFTPIVQGHLYTLSVPPAEAYSTSLDPISYHPRSSIRSARNPRQDPAKNMPAAPLPTALEACSRIGRTTRLVITRR